MFKIGEFSKIVRVSPRMLRHYEKCGIFRPAETDKLTGYRQYNALQIPIIKKIAALRDMGFSIDEIGNILPRFDDAVYMEKILKEKSDAIKAVINTENEKLRILDVMRKKLIEELKIMEYDVILKEIAPVLVLSYRAVIPDYSEEGTMWEKLMGYVQENNIICSAGEECGYSVYLDDDYKESDVEIEIGVPIDTPCKNDNGFVVKELEAIPLAAALRFSGPYEGAVKAIEKLAVWIEQNGYQICGLMRGVMFRNENEKDNPQELLTEIQFPVKKAGE